MILQTYPDKFLTRFFYLGNYQKGLSTMFLEKTENSKIKNPSRRFKDIEYSLVE